MSLLSPCGTGWLWGGVRAHSMQVGPLSWSILVATIISLSSALCSPGLGVVLLLPREHCGALQRAAVSLGGFEALLLQAERPRGVLLTESLPGPCLAYQGLWKGLGALASAVLWLSEGDGPC